MEENKEAEQPKAVKKELGMRWFKYIIYFMLFASAIMNAILAICKFAGYIYGDISDAVYEAYPSIKALDIADGITLLIMAVLALVTRFKLAAYKKSGIICLYVLYALIIVNFFVYYIVAANILDVAFWDLTDATELAQTLFSAVMLVINIVYFTRRRHMFN